MFGLTRPCIHYGNVTVMKENKDILHSKHEILIIL